MKMHVPESKRIMSLLIMLLTTSFIFAQVTVTGNVRDERGDEVIGATVLLVGSQHGVITDVDGNFKLNIPDAKTAVLQISYVGYETQKIALKGKSQCNLGRSSQCTKRSHGSGIRYAEERDTNRCYLLR